MIRIREFRDADWVNVWEFMEPIVRAGETYPYAIDMTDPEARAMWIDSPQVSFVAENDEGQVLGSYYIKPNQPTLGAHVANCGYIVAQQARGLGLATQMCIHSQQEAVARGFRAMQYNLVVETNAASVHLWQKLGFERVGRLPGAFMHKKLGFVDAFVFYKVLV